jgi:hypothetical protein
MVTLIAVGLLALVGLGIAGAMFIPRFLGSKTGSSSTFLTDTPSKYATDTDGDGIPDAIETAIGLNPAVSEFTRCAPANCGANGATQTALVQNNILFVLDSSGSMNEQIGGKSKMDLAKAAIKSFLASTASNVNVGILVFGDKGSNSAADKPVSCASADMIASIGSVNSTTIDGYLSGIHPVGYTPTGLAIRNGMNAFTGKEGQKNQMIVVTDGAETCNTDPAGAAASVKNSALKIQVDVIGFAVTSAEQSQLQAISQSGGGLFSVATNGDDLLNQINSSRANFDKFQAGAQCTIDVYKTSLACFQDVSDKTFAYMTTLISAAKGNEYVQLTNLQTNISKIYQDKITVVQDQWSAAIKANQSTLK